MPPATEQPVRRERHDAHAVMRFQGGNQAAHHDDRGRLARLLDLHHLEPAGERRILFEILLVFRSGRGGDGAQLAARRKAAKGDGMALSHRPC